MDRSDLLSRPRRFLRPRRLSHAWWWLRVGQVLVLICLQNACSEDADRSPLSGAQLRLGSVLGETALVGFPRAEAPRDFVFPEDHGPHPAYRSEWWYLTLVLADDAGRDLGVQFTLFRQALTPAVSAAGNRWQSNQIYLAHFAVSDSATGHSSDERFARGHPELVGVEAAPFALWLEDWRLTETAGRWRLQATTPASRVELELDMAVPVILQGEAGLSRKGPNQASYYYSMPGIPASGTVWVNDEPRAVQGLGWLDREWSTSVLSEGQVGWDWFALQLDDGRRLMAFQLRRRDGQRDEYDQGMLVRADGVARHLQAADFTLIPTRYWQDDEGTQWPVAWRIALGEELFHVEAVLDDQKMATSIRYWEGMVAVLDSERRRIGRGYLELTGYEDPARQWEGGVSDR